MSASVNRTENSDPPSDFEEIEIAEAELIDAYVRGQLSADERKLLEKGLRTSPELLNRLHFTRLLAAAASQVAEDVVPSQREPVVSPPKRWWQFGPILGQRPVFNRVFAASALIIILGGMALFVSWLSLRREYQQLAEQQAVIERQKLELQELVAEQRTKLNEAQQLREADQKMINDLKQSQNQTTLSLGSIVPLFCNRSYATLNQQKW